MSKFPGCSILSCAPCGVTMIKSMLAVMTTLVLTGLYFSFSFSSSADDKKLTTTLKRIGVTNIPAIEEVNMFKNDGEVIHFVGPKVQASVGANTYVVSGQSETKKLQDLLPGIINELGQENLDQLKEIAGNFPGGEAGAGDDDDDVPDLVENFEEASK
ncbi:unnamed protein product [Ectocarpus fasciculatus]